MKNPYKSRKPVVGIYFSDPNPMGSPFLQPTFVEAYTGLINYFSERGVRAVVVRGDTYKGRRVFGRYYRWSESKNAYVRVNKPISVDLIWNRNSENNLPQIIDCPSFNDVELDTICRDKFKSYEAFESFSGKTFLINSHREAKEIIKKHFPKSKYILKPRFGERSQGVYLQDNPEIKESLYADWRNILVQEFLDSSGGVPGFVDGIHEMKVWLINGQFAGCRVKQLAPGQYISNANGVVTGKNQIVDLSMIEPNLLDKIDKIKDYLQKYPLSLVRADFVNVNGEYKLVEINSRPGLANTVHDGTDFYWKIGVQIADAIVEYFNVGKTAEKLPLIIAAPHARTTVPRNIRSRLSLSEYEIWRMGDPFTGFTSYHPNASAQIKGDANRILCDLSQGSKPKLAYRHKDFYGNDIFVEGKKFTKKERSDLLVKHSKRYRKQITDSISSLVKNGEKEIFFIDHHNTASEHTVNKSGDYMPAITVSNGGKRHTGHRRTLTPEVLSCPPEFLQTFKTTFDARMDFDSEINHIYKMSHTVKWILNEIRPLYPDIKIYCMFIEYDLNLIHNPITKRNDHLAKAILRDAINEGINEIINAHFSKSVKEINA